MAHKPQKLSPEEALAEVKRLIALPAKRGGNVKIATLIGRSEAAVSQWTVVPHEHVLTLEKAVRSRVTRYQMRPDIYGAAAPRVRRKAA